MAPVSLAPSLSPTFAAPKCAYGQFDTIGIVNLVLLFFLINTLGMAVSLEEFVKHFKKPVAIAIVFCGQFIFMPALGYGLARSGIATAYGIGIFCILTCPGGAISNLVCLVFRADLSMSVAMTTSSSLAAIFMMPLNLFLYLTKTGLAENICIDPLGIAISTMTIVSGVTFGMFLRRKAPSPKLLDIMAAIGAMSGVCILFIGLAGNAAGTTPVWKAPGLVFLITAAAPIIGTVFGLSVATLANFPKPQRVPIALEIGVQNKLVAISVISLVLSGPSRDLAVSVPLIYAVFASVFAVLWGAIAWQLNWTYLPPRSGLWTALLETRKDIHAELIKAQKAHGVEDVADAIVADFQAESRLSERAVMP